MRSVVDDPLKAERSSEHTKKLERFEDELEQLVEQLKGRNFELKFLTAQICDLKLVSGSKKSSKNDRKSRILNRNTR